MESRNRFLVAVGACALALALCRAAPLRAQEAAPEPVAFPLGQVEPKLAEQIRQIILAQLTAAAGPTEPGVVKAFKLNKGTALAATVAGQPCSAEVYRPFSAVSMQPGKVEVKQFYVRTTAPWKLPGGVVVPANTYFVSTELGLKALDAATVAAQDAALARSEALSDAALGQMGQTRKAKLAAIVEAHKARTDAVADRITQLASEIVRKQEQRKSASAQVKKLQTQAPMNGTDADGKVVWEWNGKAMRYYDNLDQDILALATARNEQAAIQKATDAEQAPEAAAGAAKSQAIQAVLRKHRKRVLAGDAVGEDEMRQDYEEALGQALNSGAAAAPDASKAGGATRAPPPR